MHSQRFHPQPRPFWTFFQAPISSIISPCTLQCIVGEKHSWLCIHTILSLVPVWTRYIFKTCKGHAGFYKPCTIVLHPLLLFWLIQLITPPFSCCVRASALCLTNTFTVPTSLRRNKHEKPVFYYYLLVHREDVKSNLIRNIISELCRRICFSFNRQSGVQFRQWLQLCMDVNGGFLWPSSTHSWQLRTSFMTSVVQHHQRDLRTTANIIHWPFSFCVWNITKYTMMQVFLG